MRPVNFILRKPSEFEISEMISLMLYENCSGSCVGEQVVERGHKLKSVAS